MSTRPTVPSRVTLRPSILSVLIAIASNQTNAGIVTINTLSYSQDIWLGAADTLKVAGGTLYVSGNAVFNGSVQLGLATGTGQGSGAVVFRQNAGAASLGGTGSISMGRAVFASVGIFNQNSGLLTIGADLTIRGYGNINGVNGGVVNFGTISADVSGETMNLSLNVTNRGVLETKLGGRLDVGGGDNFGLLRIDGGSAKLHALGTAAGLIRSNNYGTVEVVGGGELQISDGAVNGPAGVIGVDGGTLTLLQFQNLGTVTLRDFLLNVRGSITTADWSAFGRGGTGTTRLIGLLYNDGQTLALSGASDNWLLQAGGSILGGTVTATGGAQLSSTDGTLDGVALKTSASLAPNSAGDKRLNVRNGLGLNNAVIELAADPNRQASLVFTGPAAQVLNGNGEIRFGPVGTNAMKILDEVRFTQNPPLIIQAGDVTIGPGTLIHGALGNIGVASEARFIHEGTIASDVPGGVINVANLTNNGRIEAKAGSTVNVGSGFTQPTGKLIIDGSAGSANPLALGGTTSGTGTITAATLIEGALAPGGADGQQAGTLSIIGDVRFGPNGQFAAQLGPASDLLRIVGNLDLSEADDALVLTQFGPIQPGASFVVATYTGDLSGTFDTVSPGFVVSYQTPHEILVTAVPEPAGAVALLASLFCGLSRRARRSTDNARAM